MIFGFRMVWNCVSTIWGLMEQRFNIFFEVVFAVFKSCTMAFACCIDVMFYGHHNDSDIPLLV